MSGTDIERPAATSIETLDLHLRYVQVDLRRMADNMATKSDIAGIVQRMDGFATKAELVTLRAEMQLLRDESTGGSVPSIIKRFGAVAKDLAAIAGVLAAIGLLAAKLMGWL
jgi:hypothetical protein